MEEFKFTDAEIQKLKSLCGDDVILKQGTKFSDLIKRIEGVISERNTSKKTSIF